MVSFAGSHNRQRCVRVSPVTERVSQDRLSPPESIHWWQPGGCGLLVEWAWHDVEWVGLLLVARYWVGGLAGVPASTVDGCVNEWVWLACGGVRFAVLMVVGSRLHTCMHARVHTRTHTHTHARAHTHTHTHTQVELRVFFRFDLSVLSLDEGSISLEMDIIDGASNIVQGSDSRTIRLEAVGGYNVTVL